MALLTVTCGIPGSGKSTWTEANAGDALVLSADALRFDRSTNRQRHFAAMNGHAQRALRRGRDVIVDVCAVTAAHRAHWLTVAVWGHARTRLVILATPHALSLERNAARPQPVPAEDMDRYVRDFDATLAQVGAEPWHEVELVRTRA